MGLVERILVPNEASAVPGIPAPGPVARRTYLVARGDSLWKIARREYGDANRWYDIFNANRRLLKPPDLIHAGMTLRLP